MVDAQSMQRRRGGFCQGSQNGRAEVEGRLMAKIATESSIARLEVGGSRCRNNEECSAASESAIKLPVAVIHKDSINS